MRDATLTHHLNATDARGLVTWTRDAANRRVQVVALTEAGEVAFGEMRCHSSAYWPIALARTVTLAVIGVIPGCDALAGWPLERRIVALRAGRE